MIGESRPAKLTVTADKGLVLSADAVSLGLIVTELVINALKHAYCGFPVGLLSVSLESFGTRQIRLVIEDSGVGVEAVRPAIGWALVSQLASVLSADLLYRRSALGGTAAELRFAAKDF